MPQYRFDITEKVMAFGYESVKDMPGNPGQEVLVERLPKEASGQVTLIVTIPETPTEDSIIRFDAEGTIYWRSNHPEAIEQIIDEAEKRVELITTQALIPGPWELDDAIRTGNWKIVGFDSEWAR